MNTSIRVNQFNAFSKYEQTTLSFSLLFFLLQLLLTIIIIDSFSVTYSSESLISQVREPKYKLVGRLHYQALAEEMHLGAEKISGDGQHGTERR